MAELLSVGLDVGTTSTQMVVSKLEVSNRASAFAVPELARCAGMAGSADAVALRNLKNGLLRLRRELGLPQTLAQAGILPRKIQENMPRIVEAVLEDPCVQTNPIPVEEFLIRRILEQVSGHG